MLTLEVTPGISLGNFYLRMPISEAIQYFIRHNSRSFIKQINKVEILYDAKEPLSTDILIKLVEDGLIFRFEPSTQRLKMLEVTDLSKVRLMYSDIVFTGPSTDSSFVKIYQTFGPTYPGRYDSVNRLYYLSYPGLTFVFPIPQQYSSIYEDNPNELPMEFPNSTTPVAVAIYLFEGYDCDHTTLPLVEQRQIPKDNEYKNLSSNNFVTDNGDDAKQDINEPASQKSDTSDGNTFKKMTPLKTSNNAESNISLCDNSTMNEEEASTIMGNDSSSINSNQKKLISPSISDIKRNNGRASRKHLLSRLHYFEQVNIKLGESIYFTGRKKTIRFNDSPQQVIMQIGSPDRIYYKKHDKLRIHSLAAMGSSSLPSAIPPNAHTHGASTSVQMSSVAAGSSIGTIQKTAVDYFYNYFSLGIDVMFNGSTHSVQKIILHTNFPGSRDFNIYVKSNFFIKMSDNQCIGPDTKFADIEDMLGKDTPHSKPLVNDSTMSNNPFGGTRFYAYDNVIFEVMKNDYLNTVTLFVSF